MKLNFQAIFYQEFPMTVNISWHIATKKVQCYGKSRKFRFCVESNEFAPVKVSTDHTDNVEMKSEKLATSTSSLEVSLHGKGGMRHEVPPEQRYSSGSLGKVWVQDYSTKYADTT